MIAAILLITGLISQAISATIPTRDSTISRRDSSETVYLVNCNYWVTNPVDGSQYAIEASKILYYSNNAASQTTSNTPDAIAAITNNGFQTWQGEQSIVGSFADGNWFIPYILGHDTPIADFAWAGYALNNYRAWTCYKDTGRLVWDNLSQTGQSSLQCNSMYFCYDS